MAKTAFTRAISVYSQAFKTEAINSAALLSTLTAH